MKSHFKFTKQQRNGIFLLLLIIVILQVVYFYVSLPEDVVKVNSQQLDKMTKELDSLRLVKMREKKPRIYPFNPNYLTDYKGSLLGMSNQEIDRLIQYRKQNKWINSAKEFQQVTQVSDSFLSFISPYFKFPEWINTAKPKTFVTNNYSNKAKSYSEKMDLNKVTAIELQRANGVGVVLSNRIVKFRNKFPGGFIADVQLHDVFGLTPEIIKRITNQFTVKTPRRIEKIAINKATVDELVTVQHIDYDLAYRIIEQRTLRDGFKSLEELTKVKGFPVNKIDIIKLYLSLD
ncbi:ComEA family DNA-binding protein [Aestuariibaculum sediminum]|uniref:Helix-hairpin-helix domain-containing protein n=1 Tax=Aestuariibaculum sediminum TaxID=2770637 RepID=A0A8J6QES9_9FLAO|nr:helix-hairpin-helix domain-containing protein [Aestuariibaculum sediminum]MBD0830529.1 helix-hairpin-helix domain-containing protein [Aestuariibaculum sediminum]